jgi:hypothetical protein
MAKTSSSAEIERAARLIEDAASVLRRLADAADILGAAISEVQRYREAVKLGEVALNWSSFVSEVEKENETLGSALQAVDLKSFSLGKLSLEAEGLHYTQIALYSEQLKKALVNRFGLQFRVTLRHRMRD